MKIRLMDRELLMTSALIDFFELSIDPMCLIDETGVIHHANRAWFEPIGYTEQEINGKHISEFVHAEQAEQIGIAIERFFTGTEESNVSSAEIQLRHKNGHYLWFHCRGKYVEGSKYAAIIARDVTKQKNERRALRTSEQLLDAFFEQSLDGFFFMMLDEPVDWNNAENKEELLDYVFSHQRITRINDAMLLQYRASKDQFIGLTPADFFEHDIEHGKEVWMEFFNSGHLHIETREKRFDDTPMWVEGDYSCIYDEYNRITGHFGIQRDVTRRKTAELELSQAKDQLDSIFNEMEDVVFSLRLPDYKVEFVTPSVERLYGISPEAFMANSDLWKDFVHPEDAGIIEETTESLQKKGYFESEYRIITEENVIKWVRNRAKTVYSENAEPVRLDGVMTDITSRKKMEAELRKLATTDPLTGLWNRRYFMNELERQHERVKRYNEKAAIVLLDLDHFKKINDTYGHAGGDQVLRSFSDTMKKMRISDTCARIGGEEFAILMPHTTSEQAVTVAERFRMEIESLSVDTESGPVQFTTSIGITNMLPEDETFDSALRRSDRALYEAKRSGRNRTIPGEPGLEMS